MAVNVRGVFLCIKHEVPLMLATAGNEGSIVIMSSTAGALLQQGQTAPVSKLPVCSLL
jgi:NAD(P)-dependent dehydrogenase (short-subunit alcohol dehydrogenase family)